MTVNLISCRIIVPVNHSTGVQRRDAKVASFCGCKNLAQRSKTIGGVALVLAFGCEGDAFVVPSPQNRCLWQFDWYYDLRLNYWSWLCIVSTYASSWRLTIRDTSQTKLKAKTYSLISNRTEQIVIKTRTKQGLCCLCFKMFSKISTNW